MTVYSVQPKDTDLDAIAALTTTAFGRAVLAAANLAALQAILGTGTPSSSTYLRGDGSWSTPAGGGGGGAVDSVNGQTGSVNLTAADVSAQPNDADLTAIAALTTTAFGRAFLALADAAAGRTALGLGTAATTASTAYDAAGAAAAAQAAAIAASQPVDADLTAIAALTTTSTGRSLLAAANAAAIRTIADAQQLDTDLTAIAALTSAADKTPYATGAGTWALADFGSFARGLLALTTSSAVRSYLGLVIGTNVQAWDADLDAIAALTTTSYGRAFLTLADAAALRAVLGTGTPSGSNFLRGDGTWAAPSASGSVATDAVWDTKGDLAVATAADTAQKLAAGANDTFLVADSAQTTGLKWATPSVARTALGLGTAATSATGDFQPNDADLTAIAALTTTSTGRSLLAIADAAAGRAVLGAVIGTNVQAWDADLDALAALATTSYGRSLLTAADAAEARASIGVQAHIDETDPFVHTALKIAYSGTVTATDVEGAIDALDASKPDATAVSAVTDGFADLLGGAPTPTTYTGQGTRAWYTDDFKWSSAVGTSGSIGETFNLKVGGTTTAVANTLWRPGIVNIATGTTANTYSAIYTPDGVKFRMDFSVSGLWDAHFWVRPNAISTDTTIRVGITSDATTETPANAAFFEHLSADSAFWRTVTRVASTETRATSARASSTEWQHFRIRRINSTTVGFSLATSTAGINTALLSEETMTFAPGSSLGQLFVAVKNGTTTTKTLDLDRWQLLLWDLKR